MRLDWKQKRRRETVFTVQLFNPASMQARRPAGTRENSFFPGLQTGEEIMSECYPGNMGNLYQD